MKLDSVQLRVQEMDLNVAGAFLALFNRDFSEIRNFVKNYNILKKVSCKIFKTT
jgi:hypothetical protein